MGPLVQAISETVIGLKAQRRGLIQSGEQLRLVYTAVLASALFEKVHRMDEVARSWTRELKVCHAPSASWTLHGL